MSQYVPPEGSIASKIVLVGEAPGTTEDAIGRPFVGGSGQLLDSVLGEVGISRSSCYITNVYKRRPPNNDFGTLYADRRRLEPSPALHDALAELRRELSALTQPHVIVPLGNEALRAVCGKSGIFNWRGSILSSPWGKAIPTLHPAYILRQYTDRPLLVRDFRRIAAESLDPAIRLPSHRMVVRPSLTDVLAYLRSPTDRMAFDIETSFPHIRSLAVSFHPDSALCIPFITSPPPAEVSESGMLFKTSPNKNSYWKPEEEWLIIQELEKLFLDPGIKKVAQNFPFDGPILEREFGIRCRGFYMDTLVAFHAIYAELPKDLGTLCSLFTRVPCYWDNDMSVDANLWLYNCYDAAVTHEISLRLDEELQGHGLTSFYHEHLNRTLLAVTRMEKRGILIDDEMKEKNRQEAEVRMAEIQKQVADLSGKQDINLKSSKQLQEFLYQTLGLRTVYNRKTGKPSTDKDALESLAKTYPHYEDLLLAIREHNSLKTLVSNLLSIDLPDDKCFRTHLNIAGTVTGRYASSDPMIDVGTNLQNIKRGPFRKMFRARPGYLLIKADYSQAENRIIIWKARVGRIIERYLNDPSYDNHRYMASLIFRIPESEISKDQRTIAKNGVYGTNYDMREKTAAATYKIPLEMARLVRSRYLAEIPEIPIWWQSVQSQLNQTRTLVSPFGRKRIFMDRLNEDLYRSAYSHECQCIVADLTSKAIVALEESLPDQDCRLLLQVHDEIVGEARESLARDYAKIFKQKMEIPIQIHQDLPPLVIPAEVSIGPNWYDQERVC